MRTVVEGKDMLRIPQPARKVNKPLRMRGRGALVGLPTLFLCRALFFTKMNSYNKIKEKYTQGEQML